MGRGETQRKSSGRSGGRGGPGRSRGGDARDRKRPARALQSAISQKCRDDARHGDDLHFSSEHEHLACGPAWSQVCASGSAEPGSAAFELAAAAGELLARHGITLVSGCGSPATRVAAERALAAGGLVVSIIPSDDIGTKNWPCSVLIPCGMGDARNLLMALAGDACLVIGGRAGTISEVRRVAAPAAAVTAHRLRRLVGSAGAKPGRRAAQFADSAVGLGRGAGGAIAGARVDPGSGDVNGLTGRSCR